MTDSCAGCVDLKERVRTLEDDYEELERDYDEVCNKLEDAEYTMSLWEEEDKNPLTEELEEAIEDLLSLIERRVVAVPQIVQDKVERIILLKMLLSKRSG